MDSTSIYATRDTGGEAFKVDLINDAYSMLRISGMTVDPTPEDLEIALLRLETMMDEWQSRNIDIGYFFEDEPDPNTECGVLRAFWHAIASNLALRLTPDFNKQLHPILLAQARQAYSNMSGRVARARINQIQYPRRQARGSGSTRWFSRWYRFYRLEQPTVNASTTRRMFIGDVNDFNENFETYLRPGETITAHHIVADMGLDISQAQHTDTDVFYRVTADVNNEGLRENRQITIVIDTSSGRRETRALLFQLVDRRRFDTRGTGVAPGVPGIPDIPNGNTVGNFGVTPVLDAVGQIGVEYIENLNNNFFIGENPPGVPAENLTVTVTGAPNWMTLTDGLLTGTPPDVDAIGSYQLTATGCIPSTIFGEANVCLDVSWTVEVVAPLPTSPVQWTARQNWLYGGERLGQPANQRIVELDVMFNAGAHFNPVLLTIARTTPETLPVVEALGVYFRITNPDESNIYVGWTQEGPVLIPATVDFLNFYGGAYAYVKADRVPGAPLVRRSGLERAGQDQELLETDITDDEMCLVLRQGLTDTTVELYRNGSLFLTTTTPTREDIRQFTTIQTYQGPVSGLVNITGVEILQVPTNPIPGVTHYTENDGV